MAVKNDKDINFSKIPEMKVAGGFIFKTNTLSHSTPIHAIAELIDNAYDAEASEVCIDYKKIKGFDCLTFVDNGNGLDKDELHKMMSLGYSEKDSPLEIGRYGNGFKSGALSLGNEVLVFSQKDEYTLVLGFYSTAFNDYVTQNVHVPSSVLIPIVSWKKKSKKYVLENEDDDKESLKIILEYSCFKDEKELLDVFFHGSSKTSNLGLFKAHGTIILIYELKKQISNLGYEFDFSVKNDIRLRSIEDNEDDPTKSTTDNSLRAFLKILYLSFNKAWSKTNAGPNLQIIKLRNVQIPYIYDNTIKKREKYKYYSTKNVGNQAIVSIGIANENIIKPGLLIYHQNRLIEAYKEHKFLDKSKPYKILIVVQQAFLKPHHNKEEYALNEDYKVLRRQINIYLDEYMKTNELKNINQKESRKKRTKKPSKKISSNDDDENIVNNDPETPTPNSMRKVDDININYLPHLKTEKEENNELKASNKPKTISNSSESVNATVSKHPILHENTVKCKKESDMDTNTCDPHNRPTKIKTEDGTIESSAKKMKLSERTDLLSELEKLNKYVEGVIYQEAERKNYIEQFNICKNIVIDSTTPKNEELFSYRDNQQMQNDANNENFRLRINYYLNGIKCNYIGKKIKQDGILKELIIEFFQNNNLLQFYDIHNDFYEFKNVTVIRFEKIENLLGAVLPSGNLLIIPEWEINPLIVFYLYDCEKRSLYCFLSTLNSGTNLAVRDYDNAIKSCYEEYEIWKRIYINLKFHLVFISSLNICNILKSIRFDEIDLLTKKQILVTFGSFSKVFNCEEYDKYIKTIDAV